MAKNLLELKDELYDAFNKAKSLGDQFAEYDILDYPEEGKAAMGAYQAAAKSAEAIVKIETELREREAATNGMRPLHGKP